MPNPASGAGADVSKGLRKYSWAWYMGTAAGAAAIPPAKLLGAEPAAPWVRQGRVRDDQVTWSIPDPTYLEGRAGFNGTLKYRVVKQAEMPIATIPLDESDPEVLSRLRGNAAGSATSLSSGAYTGYKFIYQSGQVFNAKVLLVGTGVNGTFERHIYGGNSYVTFKMTTADQYEGIEVSLVFANDASNYAFTLQEWE